MNFINLTPHKVVIIETRVSRGARPARHIEPSGAVARVHQESIDTGRLMAGVRIFNTTWGEIEGLPEQEEGKAFIVSGLVLSALRESGDMRGDVFAPSGLVRNEAGQVVGCEGLRLN